MRLKRKVFLVKLCEVTLEIEKSGAARSNYYQVY